MSAKRKGLKNRYINGFAGAVDMPAAAVAGGFRVELFENTEMLIENHKGIIEYGNDIVKVNCGSVVMCVQGENLTLLAMNDGGISLKGRIVSINYSN